MKEFVIEFCYYSHVRNKIFDMDKIVMGKDPTDAIIRFKKDSEGVYGKITVITCKPRKGVRKDATLFYPL